MPKVIISFWGNRPLLYLPLYLADRLGFFTQVGLEVSLTGGGNDDDVFADIVEGRSHFGVGDPSFVARGYERGQDTRVVAGLVTSAALWGVTQHEEIRPLQQASDFVQLRVGSPPRPCTTFEMLSGLKQRHPRVLKSLQIVETGIGQLPYLLASNQVDMVVECEPNVSDALHQGLRLVCNMSDFYPKFLLTGLMTSQAIIETNPELVLKVVAAFQRALRLCRGQLSEMIDVAISLFPDYDSTIIELALQRMASAQAWPAEAVVSPRAWSNALKLQRSIGAITSAPPFDKVVDQRFAHAALQNQDEFISKETMDFIGSTVS